MHFHRVVTSLIFFGSACVLSAQQPAAPARASPPGCPETRPVFVTPPNEPNGAPWRPGLFYVNENKTIWHAVDIYGLISGEKGNKTAWLRPWGQPLTITGRRLDGESAPLQADVPGQYPTGLQMAGVYFPTAGCWEVTAQAAGQVLTFVTQVK